MASVQPVAGTKKKASLKRKQAESSMDTPVPGDSPANAIRILQKRTKAPAIQTDADILSLSTAKSDDAPNPEKISARGNVEMPPDVEMTGLQLYWHLASPHREIREVAAAKLVSEIASQQKAFFEGTSNQNPSDKIATDEPSEHPDYSPSLHYALRRLIRGLSSPRGCARQGFAVALTNLLAEIRVVEIDAIQPLIEKHLEIVGNSKNQDNRDTFFGRIFACGSLVRSGRIKEDLKVGEKKKTVAYQVVKHLANEMIALAKQKSFFSQPTVSVLVDLINQMESADIKSTILDVPAVVDFLKVKQESASADQLLLSLALWPYIPDDMVLQIPLLPQTHDPAYLFSPDHLPNLIPALQDSSSSHPRVHAVWKMLIDLLLSPSSSSLVKLNLDFSPSLPPHSSTSTMSQGIFEESGKHPKSKSSKKESKRTIVTSAVQNPTSSKTLKTFWELVVENNLLPYSHVKRNLAFELLCEMLDRIMHFQAPENYASVILSEPIVRCIINSLMNKSNLLHPAALKVLHTMLETSLGNHKLKISIVCCLQRLTNGAFDALSKTPTVRQLMQGFGVEESMQFIDYLRSSFFGGSSTSSSSEDLSESSTMSDPSPVDDSFRRWIVQQMYSFCRHNSLPPADKSKIQKDVFLLLSSVSLFSIKEANVKKKKDKALLENLKLNTHPLIPFSDEILHLCKSRALFLMERLFHSSFSPPSLKPQVQHKDGAAEDDNKQGEIEEGSERLVGNLFSEIAQVYERIIHVSGIDYLKSDEIDDESRQLLSSLFSSIDFFRKAVNSESDSKTDKAISSKVNTFRLLLSVVYIYSTFDPSIISEIIPDLLSLSPRLLPSIYPSDSNKDRLEDKAIEGDNAKHVIDDIEEEPEVMDALVDILLSLLSRASPPLSSAVHFVFKRFCHEVTAIGLSDILHVIGQGSEQSAVDKENNGDNSDDEEDDDDDDEEDDDDDDEEDDDEEEPEGELGLDESDEESKEEDEEDKKDEEAEVKDDDNEDCSDTVSRIMLTGDKVKLISAKKEDKEEKDDDDDDDDDVVMDDEAMFRIDHQLSEVFKQKKVAMGGEGNKEAKIQLQKFRSQALELIEIFIRKCQHSYLLITIAKSLLRILSSKPISDLSKSKMSESEALLVRIKSVLKNKICSSRLFTHTEEVAFAVASEAKDFMEDALQLAEKAKTKAFADISGLCALWTVKVLKSLHCCSKGGESAGSDGNSGESERFSSNLFSRSLSSVFSRKNCNLKVSFFMDALKRHPWMASSFLPIAIQNCTNAKNGYLKLEASILLSKLFLFRPYSSDFIETVKSQPSILEAWLIDVISSPQKASHWKNAIDGAVSVVQALPLIYGDDGSVLSEIINWKRIRVTISDMVSSNKVPSKKVASSIQKLDACIVRCCTAGPTPFSARVGEGVVRKEKVMSNRKRIKLEKEKRRMEESNVMQEKQDEEKEVLNGKEKKRRNETEKKKSKKDEKEKDVRKGKNNEKTNIPDKQSSDKTNGGVKVADAIVNNIEGKNKNTNRKAEAVDAMKEIEENSMCEKNSDRRNRNVMKTNKKNEIEKVKKERKKESKG